MKKRAWIIIIIMMGMFSVPMLSYAQDEPGDTDQNVPIDGGVSLLVAAGVAYGIIAVRKNKQGEDRSNR